MHLSKEEEMMLAGEYGEAIRRSMKILVTLGDLYEAKQLLIKLIKE